MRFALLAALVLASCQSESPVPGDAQDHSAARSAPLDAPRKQPLPNWATPEEAELERKADPPDVSPRAAPPSGFRVPAEFEPMQVVVLTWAGDEEMLEGIALAAATAGADVWVVGGPSAIPGVPEAKYRRLDFRYNSVWARDYGPVGIDEHEHTLAIVDTTYRHYASRPADDAIPCKLAETVGAACFGTGLILDGGNYMTDGRGNAFLTRRVYDWNRQLSTERVDELLKAYLGAETLHILDYASEGGYPADGTGHLDMFAKLLAPCKVLVAETEDEPYKHVTDAAAEYFAALSCGEGKHYEVSRVRAWSQNGTWYTYTNSLIVNRTVIIPFYRDGDNDAASRVYRSALPGYEVVGVFSDSTITMGGSIHCVTKDLPALKAPPPSEAKF